MNCFFCKCSFLTINLLMEHIRIKHKTFMNCEIKCQVKDCNQNFANVYHLKKHILHTHYMNEETPEAVCNVAVNKIPNNQLSNLPENPLHHITNNFHNVHENNMLYQLNNIQEIDVDKFKSLVFTLALRCISKLYANGTLHRKVVHEIVSNMFVTYLSSCMQFLMHKYKEMNELCCYLRVIEQGFKIFKSEFKTLQYLKEINVYSCLKL